MANEHASTVNVAVLGMVWYRRADYGPLRTSFVDSDKLPRTYDEWLAKAETGRRVLRAKGNVVVRVVLDPDEFATWCDAKKLPRDEKARGEFAGEHANDYTRLRYRFVDGLEAELAKGGDVFTWYEWLQVLIPHSPGGDRLKEISDWAAMRGTFA